MRIEGQVLEQGPRLILVLDALRDADDRPVDVARAIQVLLGVVDRCRRGCVGEAGMLGLDERDAPLAVDHHCDLPDLEGV